MLLAAEIKEWGNSYGIRISKKAAEKAGLKPGDRVSVPIEKQPGDADALFGLWKGSAQFTREHDDRY